MVKMVIIEKQADECVNPATSCSFCTTWIYKLTAHIVTIQRV